MFLGSNSHSQKGSHYASWEILLQSLGWAAGPSQAGESPGEMLGDATFQSKPCFCPPSTLDPPQVRFSLHMDAPARAWDPH